MLKKLLLAALAAGSLPFMAQAQTTTYYYLDFSNIANQVYQVGWTPLFANQVANTQIDVDGISGVGSSTLIDFTMANVGSWTNASLPPAIASGFYTFGNNTNPHDFTISGFSLGDEIKLYAVAGWDGNGRGGVVSFGGFNTQAQTLGNPTGPTTDLTLSNFTLINSSALIVDGTGIVSGSLHGAGGVGSATEGQVGAFIIEVVTPVPEPSTYALIFAVGCVGLIVLRRRKMARSGS